MAIWEIKADLNHFYKLGLVEHQANWKFITYGFNGTRLKPNWEPFEVFVENPHESLKYGDFPSITGILIMNTRAFDEFHKLLTDAGEFLSLISKSEAYPELYAYNVTQVCDCLDREKSVIKRFDDGGIMWVAKPVFKLAAIGDSIIFKIPEHKLGRIFVSDTFRNVVINANLQGLLFTEIETI